MANLQVGGIYRVGKRFVDAHGKEIDPPKAKKQAAPKEEAPKEPDAGELPEDFPKRKELVEAGLTTTDAVASKSDEELIALKGIGEASVKDIRDALNG